MMVKRFTILISVLLSISLHGIAQDVSFSVNSPGNVIQGRNFSLTFRLKNAQAAAPKAPQLPHCELIYGPATSTMASSSYINGQMTSSTSIDYTFTFRAIEPGKVTVPPVTITANGKQMKSQEITFTIFPMDSDTPQQGSSANQRPQVHVDDINTQTPGPVSPQDLFVHISLSRDRVYEQEPIIASIKVYTKFRISSFLANTQPSFDGFMSEELPVNNELTPDHFNGQNYYSAELKKVIIYPQKSGKLSITSGKYDITVVQYENVSMGFFTTRQPVERKVVTSSNSVSINVLPLPEPKPARFNGAVGKFSIESSLSPERLLTNEAATYSLTIKGTGNIKYITEPEIEFPHGFDEYTPRKEIDAAFNGSNMTGTAKIDYTIVPQEMGKAVIPSVPFVYFNPSTKEYVTLSTKEYNVNIGRGANAPASVEQKAIDKSMSDILHIKSQHAPAIDTGHYVFNTFLYWAIYIISIIVLVTIIVIYRKQMRLNSDLRRRQLARANKEARRRFKMAKDAMSSQKRDIFYEEISKALWGYLGDKLGIPASQLLRDNISQQLSDIGAQQATINSVIDIIDQCEMARFTPVQSENEMDNVYNEAINTVKQLENIKSK